MVARIALQDVDRPNEPLFVYVKNTSPRVIRVGVPNTIVEFDMYRSEERGVFEGALGGRYFTLDPSSLAKRKGG